jgi:hypothetical protein
MTQRFDSYTYPANDGLENRVPYIGESDGLLTTSLDFNGFVDSNWWGTSKSLAPMLSL